jgi:AraC-like DNA-binding protein
MIPGLWGAPLKAVSAFAPPMSTQDFNLYKNEVHAQFDDYDAGMEYAQRTGKPVIKACHAGFYDALIPIFVENEYMGSLCVGQFLKEKPEREKLESIRRELDFLDLSIEELEEYCARTRVLTEEETEGLIELVQMLGEYICETYPKLRFFESMRPSDPIHLAEQYIKRHYAKNLSVDGIARSVGMSKSYFLHKFTEQTGTSPIAYLNSYRILQAAEMLKTTDASVLETALSCGFQNVSYFIQVFKRKYGTTPHKFKK